MAERAIRLNRSSFMWLFASLAVVLPGDVEAQEGCEFAEGSALFTTQPDPRGGSITRATTPHFECDGDVDIRADSAVAYSFDRMSILYGSVRYQDPQRELRADFARYFSEVGRLQAEGNVAVTNFEDGSTVQNGDLVYLRQTDYRDIEEMTFTTGDDGVRPHATVYPRRPAPTTEAPGTDPDIGAGVTDAAPAGDPPPPAAPAAADAQDASTPQEPAEPEEPEAYDVVADRIFFRGDAYFDASGTVEIVRDSLFAFADAAEYDGDDGELLLEGSARVESSSYDLVGRSITMASAADGSDEVRARENAELTGEDLKVTAPLIALHLVDGEVEHMVAVPLPESTDSLSGASGPTADPPAGDTTATAARPVAISQDIELTGDSLDLAAPGGELERIFAAGNARSVSSGRAELNVEALPDLARHDWMDADSIEVLLSPVEPDPLGATAADAPPEDSYEIERIVARGRARSLYRLTPSDSTAVPGVDPPAVSYMVADQITIFMVDGQADRVESVGQVEGWHLEPLRQAAEEPSDEPAQDSTGPGDAPAPPDPGGGSSGDPPDNGGGRTGP